MLKKTNLLLLSLLIGGVAFGQKKKDKSIFKEYKPGYYQNSILKDINAINAKIEKEENEKLFFMDHSNLDLPIKKNLYKIEWANPSLSQGNTGSCWCFSTTSMYESEVKRLTGKEVKFSEMYTVYHEFIEKARGFVQTRGKSIFEQGSEANAVTRSLKKNGIVPAKEYTGLKDGRKFHTHAKMYKEMKNYLQTIKAGNAWNEEEVIATIKSIMNHYIGIPPTSFVVDGKTYTPQSYMKEYCNLNPEDYVEVLSYKQEPYWQQVEYKVPDNWWHSKEYYNVPLDVFMKVLKDGIRNGYTSSIGGDVSEAGFVRTTNAALVPTFDIPSEYINEDARQFRFSNGCTTDDHGMHLMGYYTDKNGSDWYLIKDSSSGSRNNDPKAAEFGYYFFSSDYIKLKMMGFTIHKDALKKYMKKF